MKVLSLRIEDEVYGGVRKLAGEASRSINGQIGWMLRENLGGIKVVSEEGDTRVIPDEIPVVDEEPSELDRVVEVSGRIEAAMNRRVEDSEVEFGEMNSGARNRLKWEYIGLKREKAGVEEFIKLAEKYGVT